MGRPKGSRNKNKPEPTLECQTCSTVFVPNYYQRYNIKIRRGGIFCSKICYFNRTVTEETLKRQSTSHIGKIASIEQRRKQSLALTGRKNTIEHIEKTRAGIIAFYDRVGRKTDERKLIRHRIEYKTWRTSVFERDDYTCQECGERGGELNADHIKPWSLYEELRYSIENGRTLCVRCHRKTETYGGKIHRLKVTA